MGFLIHTTISFSSLTPFTVATEFLGFVLGVLHNSHLQSATSHSHLKERKQESRKFRYRQYSQGFFRENKENSFSYLYFSTIRAQVQLIT